MAEKGCRVSERGLLGEPSYATAFAVPAQTATTALAAVATTAAAAATATC